MSPLEFMLVSHLIFLFLPLISGVTSEVMKMLDSRSVIEMTG